MSCSRCGAKLEKAKEKILNLLYREGPTRCSWLAEKIDCRDDSEKYDFYIMALYRLLDEGLVIVMQGDSGHFKLSEVKQAQMLEDQIIRLVGGTWNTRERIKENVPFHLQDLSDKTIKELVSKGRLEFYDYDRRLRAPVNL